MIAEIRFRRKHRKERRFENYLWGNGRIDGVRDKRRAFHTRTQEKVPQVCGKGCGGYYWKELVSPYLKTMGMLENCVGKQKPWGPGANQGEHARQHAYGVKMRDRVCTRDARTLKTGHVHGELCKHDSLCWNFFSYGNFIMQNTCNLCEHQWWQR